MIKITKLKGSNFFFLKLYNFFYLLIKNFRKEELIEKMKHEAI